MPWNLQDLRHECQRRTLSASGTQHELIDRLAGHDSLQARAFSIAIKRIAVEQTRKPVSGYVGAACTDISCHIDPFVAPLNLRLSDTLTPPVL